MGMISGFVMENPNYTCTDAEPQGPSVSQPKVLSKQRGTVYSPPMHHSKWTLNATAAICKRQPDRDKVPPTNQL